MIPAKDDDIKTTSDKPLDIKDTSKYAFSKSIKGSP